MRRKEYRLLLFPLQGGSLVTGTGLRDAQYTRSLVSLDLLSLNHVPFEDLIAAGPMGEGQQWRSMVTAEGVREYENFRG